MGRWSKHIQKRGELVQKHGELIMLCDPDAGYKQYWLINPNDETVAEFKDEASLDAVIDVLNQGMAAQEVE